MMKYNNNKTVEFKKHVGAYFNIMFVCVGEDVLLLPHHFDKGRTEVDGETDGQSFSQWQL